MLEYIFGIYIRSIVILNFKRMLNSWRPSYLFTLISIYMINLIRARELVQHPSFWAEDGLFFFRESLELGVRSLLAPVLDHFNTIPRVLALLALVFPIKFAPLFYILTAGLISSACIAYFVKDSFSWIIPNRSLRFFLAILMSFTPGTEEIFFSYCTLGYVFYGLITLLFLENDSYTSVTRRDEPAGGPTPVKLPFSRYSWRRTILISLLWFTTGHGIVFLPILVLDVIQLFRFRLFNEITRPIALLFSLIFSILINIFHSNSDAASNAASIFLTVDRTKIIEAFVQIFHIYIDNFMFHLTLQPLLGVWPSRQLVHFGPLAFYLVGISLLGSLGLALFYIFRRSKVKSIQIAYSEDSSVFNGKVSHKTTRAFMETPKYFTPNNGISRFVNVLIFSNFTFVLTALVRPALKDTLKFPNLVIDERYAFQPVLLSLLFWTLLIHIVWRRSTQVKSQAALVFCFLVIVSHLFGENRGNFWQRLESFEKVWDQRATEIDFVRRSLKKQNELNSALLPNQQKADTVFTIGPIPCRPIWWGSCLPKIELRQ